MIEPVMSVGSALVGIVIGALVIYTSARLASAAYFQSKHDYTTRSKQHGEEVKKV